MQMKLNVSVDKHPDSPRRLLANGFWVHWDGDDDEAVRRWRYRVAKIEVFMRRGTADQRLYSKIKCTVVISPEGRGW